MVKRHTHNSISRKQTFLTLGVGGATFIGLYLWYWFRGEFQSDDVEYLYQNLGEEALKQEPLQSLLNIHVQPPGLNAIYAMAHISPIGFDRTLQIVFFAAGLGSVLLVASLLINIRANFMISITFPAIYALLPSTVLFSLWPYNTALVAFLVALALWGTSLYPSRPAKATITWSLGILGIFLLRPSFVWIIAIVVALIPLLFIEKRVKHFVLVSVLVILPVLTVQAHYFFKFDSLSTSSWSGQNIVKGLIFSGVINQQDIRNAAKGDSCLESIADNLSFWDEINDFDQSCFESDSLLNPEPIALAKSYKKDGTTIQHNSIERLTLASHWNELAVRTLQQNPSAIPELMLGVGTLQSGVELTLSPGYLYESVRGNLTAGMPFSSLTRPLGAIFPVAAIGLIFLASIAVVSPNTRKMEPALVFSAGVGLLLSNFFISISLEYGENNRFFVEVYPALIVCCAIAVGYLWPLRDQKIQEFQPVEDLPLNSSVSDS